MLYNINVVYMPTLRCKGTTKKWNVQINFVFFAKFALFLRISKKCCTFVPKLMFYGKIVDYRRRTRHSKYAS